MLTPGTVLQKRYMPVLTKLPREYKFALGERMMTSLFIFVGTGKSPCYAPQQEESDMATDMATIIDSDSGETAGLKDRAVMDVEYPVQLVYTREPVMCLVGTVSVIRPGRRDLALSDMEWQDLELPELSELQEPPELSEPVGSGDGADGK